MSAYTRGYAFEQKISGQLTQDGYWCMEARGSHGIVDVIALKPGQVLLIQAKTDGVISIRDWNQLLELGERLNAVPLLAWRPRRGHIEYWRLIGPRVARQSPVYEVWLPDAVASRG